MTTSSAHQPSANVERDDDLPATNDPAVLRELLRQARQQLRLHQSFDQVIAENAARAEALLRETSKVHEDAHLGDALAVRETVTTVRQALSDALIGIDRLEELMQPMGDGLPLPADRAPGESAATTVVGGQAHRIDVLMHPVTSPSLARAAQQHLAGIDGVERAEVRELAEGLLRITVESHVPINGETFAGWEPERARTIKTANADVLEIGLDG